MRQRGHNLAYIALVTGVGDAAHTGQVSRYITAHQARLDAASGSTGRRFGVELEIVGMGTTRAAQVLAAAGIDVRDEGYNHHTRSYWKVLTDASVGGGCEVVSPPLRGEAGLEELRKAMTALREAGATVNTACGMHVHVDMAGLTGEQIAQFVAAYVERQDVMDRLVAPSRRGNQYCQRMAESELQRICAQFVANRSASSYNRYQTVNVMSFTRYGTIEIRQHQGTVSGRKATAWIRMLLGLVETIEAGRLEALPRGTGFLVELTDTSDTFRQQDSAFLVARMEELAR
jgi:hypothetical protein